MRDFKITIFMPKFYNVQAEDELQAAELADTILYETRSLDPKPFKYSIVEIEEEIPQTA